MRHYCVGFNWNGEQERSQLDRFLKKGIWENGYDNKFQNTVNSIPKDSKIAAKTTYTRKQNGKTISVLKVHAIGTVTNNPRNGRIIEVDWAKDFQPFELDGKGAYRSTISLVNNPDTVKLIFDHKPGKVGAPGIPPENPPALPINPDDKKYDHHLNQILYGPPGTGKTYNTINKATAIIEQYKTERLSNYYDSRQTLKDRFDELLIEDWDNPEGQIAFITFHQSMSYEDFIEGIKAKTENGNVVYEVIDGIFKKMAKLARQRQLWSIAVEDQKVGLTEEIFKELYNEFVKTLNPITERTTNCELKTKEQHTFGLFRNTAGSISIKAGMQTTVSATYDELRKVHFENKVPQYQSYEPIIIEKILTTRNYQATESDHSQKPYVLIIDEINRGNISQIFGELITLIEEDKRNGNPESIEVILPYSKEKFSVPKNLYIIGTMNTADRSVEALDTALRRRFSFEEMPPKPELLNPERMLWQFWWENADYSWDNDGFIEKENAFHELIGFPSSKNNDGDKGALWKPMDDEKMQRTEQIESLKELARLFTGVNPEKLLRAINGRIGKLLGKDHRIGHAYLINVRSVVDLKIAFFSKIIPLLQEYFYGDFGRIGLVIGSAFFAEDFTDDIPFLATDYDAGDLNQTKVYVLKNEAHFADNKVFMDAVKSIYEP